MAGEGHADAVALHALVAAETASPSVQEIDADTYGRVSGLIARLRAEEYDGVAATMQESLLSLVTGLAVLLVEARMSKSPEPGTPDYANLLDEEKRALEFEDEAREARSAVLSAILGGKPRILETISERHRQKLAVVVTRRPVDALVGTDLRPYGPYGEHEVACLPIENAVTLEAQGAAIRLRWADFAHGPSPQNK